jgi:hypothetical protein
MRYFIVGIMIFIILLIIFINIKMDIIEPAGPDLPSGSQQGQINGIKDMRAFLEQMYIVCILNENDQHESKVNSTICYKTSVLGTYLWPLLGPYTYRSVEELTSVFGASTNPTSASEASSQSSEPSPIPIILNDHDYQLFLQIAIIGKILEPFAIRPMNNWNTATVWYKDGRGNVGSACTQRWGGYQASVAFVTKYIKELTVILGYFHSQNDSANKLQGSDTIFTKLY